MQLFFFLPANVIICQDIGLLVGEKQEIWRHHFGIWTTVIVCFSSADKLIHMSCRPTFGVSYIYALDWKDKLHNPALIAKLALLLLRN